MERITVSMERLNALAMSNCNSTGAGEGGSAATPWKAASPSSQPAKATPSIPITTAPAIWRAASAAISAKPTSAAAGANAEKSPNATSVAGLSTTMPALRKPTKATNSPMPAAMPSFKLRGIALTSHSRTGSTLSVTNSTPERKHRPQRRLPMVPGTNHHRVGEEGVLPHAGRKRDGIVRQPAHRQRSGSGSQAGGHEHGAEIHPGIGKNGRVDDRDVGHRQKRRRARDRFAPPGGAVRSELKAALQPVGLRHHGCLFAIAAPAGTASRSFRKGLWAAISARLRPAISYGSTSHLAVSCRK